MSNYATMLFNKIIEQNDIQALDRMQLDVGLFNTQTDKDTYKFLEDFALKNAGKTPSYAAVVTELPSFNHIPGVEDSYEYLVGKIKNEKAASDFIAIYDGVSKTFADGQSDMDSYLSDLTDKISQIKIRTNVRKDVGESVKGSAQKVLDEYLKRKRGESAKRWTSSFSVVGEYTAGNVYVVFGKSGRGKSAVTIREVVHLAEQGANVLLWSMEMPFYDVMTRIYPILAADAGLYSKVIDEETHAVGFDSRNLMAGALDDATEAQFIEFLTQVNASMAGNITVRGVDDDDFYDRSLKALESDIIETEADVVVLDPFYYLDYERNTSGTKGGDAAATSVKLRRLTGRHKVVTIALTQAEEKDQMEYDDGEREVSLPNRSDVKKTKALLEDASQLIAVDTNDIAMVGEVGLRKGRFGGEGTSEKILFLPRYGVIKSLVGAMDEKELRKEYDF